MFGGNADSFWEDLKHILVIWLTFSFLFSIFFVFFYFRRHFLSLPRQNLGFSTFVFYENIFSHGSASIQDSEIHVFKVIFIENGLTFTFSLELNIDIHSLSDHEMESILEFISFIRITDNFNVHGFFRFQQTMFLNRFKYSFFRFFFSKYMEISLNLTFIFYSDFSSSIF